MIIYLCSLTRIVPKPNLDKQTLGRPMVDIIDPIDIIITIHE